MEAKAKLTAFNADIQKHIEKGNAEAKREIIQEVKEEALKNGINFNRLFPLGTKRYKILDEIVYMLSGGGICKIASETLAKNTDASIRTVKDAVKGIKQLGSFIVAGLADGKNKYVFLYKKHADFKEIITNVFFLDTAQHTAQQIAHQENAESVDTPVLDGEMLDSNSNNSIIFKHEKDIIKESIESDVEQSSNDKEEKAKAHEYLHSWHQKQLYTIIKYDTDHLHKQIKDSALIIALRAGSNLDINNYGVAMVAVNKIDKALNDGVVVGSIPALFEKIYKDRINYSAYYTDKNKKASTPVKRDTSYLYNWLEDDTQKPSI